MCHHFPMKLALKIFNYRKRSADAYSVHLADFFWGYWSSFNSGFRAEVVSPVTILSASKFPKKLLKWYIFLLTFWTISEIEGLKVWITSGPPGAIDLFEIRSKTTLSRMYQAFQYGFPVGDWRLPIWGDSCQGYILVTEYQCSSIPATLHFVNMIAFFRECFVHVLGYVNVFIFVCVYSCFCLLHNLVEI